MTTTMMMMRKMKTERGLYDIIIFEHARSTDTVVQNVYCVIKRAIDGKTYGHKTNIKNNNYAKITRRMLWIMIINK